jgi:CubicO group peptidase (beta-lactamase class C family)
LQTKKLFLGSLLVGGILALIRLLFAKSPSTKPAPASHSYEGIDSYIESQMQRLHIPGGSLAIVEGDRIVHLRGFGVARPGGETPTPQTPFFIGSLTKSITALAVMQLVEAGKVELDASVQRYLPWFRVADAVASAQMTVRHLLNQTSGLTMLSGFPVLADFDQRPCGTERQVRALSTLKTDPVGEKCAYCNLNYNILGLIVEVTSGESYSAYVKNHIFNPLGMSHSYAFKPDAERDGLAIGHRYWFSRTFPSPNQPVATASLPSGQLISCAEDMAHYLIAHLNGGRYEDVQILSEAGINEMHRGVKVLKMGNVAGGFYGMGWFDIDIDHTKTYSHGGNVPDFSAYMALIPEQKKGLVMLFNADPYGLPFVLGEVGENTTAILAGKQPGPIKLDFIQWIMRILPLIPLLQVVGVFATLRSLRRWNQNPALHPGRRRMCFAHILLPLIPNLSIAGILVYLRTNGLLKYLHAYNPDLAWIIRISGGFAAVWTFLRTGLVLQTLHKHRR